MDEIKNYIIDDLVKDNLVKYLSWRIGYFCFLFFRGYCFLKNDCEGVKYLLLGIIIFMFDFYELLVFWFWD